MTEKVFNDITGELANDVTNKRNFKKYKIIFNFNILLNVAIYFKNKFKILNFFKVT
jgi:hypothetical protein